MNIVLKQMASIIFMVALSGVLSAQERTLPGAVLGINAGYMKGYSIYWPYQRDYPIDNASEDNVTSKRIGLSLIFPKVFSDGFGLSVKADYAEYDVRIVDSRYRSVQTGGGELVYGLIERQTQLTYTAAELGFGLYAQFGKLARLEFGPYGSAGFRPKLSETARILEPIGGYSGPTEWTARQVQDDEIVVVETGAELGLSFEIPLGSDLALLPSLRFRGGAVTDSEDDEWWVNGSVGAGVGLLFGTTNGE